MHYSRRKWLQIMASAATLPLFSCKTTAGLGLKSQLYYLANVENQTPILPEGKVIPLDWTFSEVPTEGSVKWTWVAPFPSNKAALLRLTSATDVREECTIEVLLGKTDKVLGIFDVRFAHYYQPFELAISSSDMAVLLKEGIKLKMLKGSKPFWFFSAKTKQTLIPESFLPHLIVDDKSPNNAWKDRLQSMASVQSFGWMQGINLDALQDLSQKSTVAKQVLLQQLDLYFTNNRFVYDGLVNSRLENQIQGVEFLLPFSILAQHNPSHPSLKTAVDFCKKHANTEGVIGDGTGNNRPIKTEECYTISYPLAVLSKVLNQPELAHLATINLQYRVKRLSNAQSIFQRTNEQTQPIFENWGRGVTWYLLGLARTLPHLPENADTKALKTEFLRAAEWVIKYQREDGLWNCFLHQPETGVETSGSAGIAAALAVGIRNGLLPQNLQNVVDKAWYGLQKYLTPDGFLSGTAQVNKGGEGLQRNGFRVISPYTLGFLGLIKTNSNLTD